MFGLSDIQYLYEFLFWLIIYLSLKRIWNKEQVRVLYGYSVASLNFVAAIFFMSPLYGNFNIYNAIAFAFLHCMVGIVLITTMKVNKKINDIKTPVDPEL
tara:strand:- start:1175 stop:1474 length:300 start_codon:yes stop_codon:yes gene_type:complete